MTMAMVGARQDFARQGSGPACKQIALFDKNETLDLLTLFQSLSQPLQNFEGK